MRLRKILHPSIYNIRAQAFIETVKLLVMIGVVVYIVRVVG